ncbi:hypothetical protein H0H92_003543 [Tricholoma furcatifolium]|nr:hypothetical protein H0H92_003543 [Tricholoma furcatifolium]
MVIETLRDLDPQKILHFLGVRPARVEQALRFLLQELSKGKLDVADEIWFTSFVSQFAAFSTSTSLLGELMLLRLRQKDYAAVIDLYDKFRKSVGSRQIWEHEEENEDDWDLQRKGLVFDENYKGVHRDNRVHPGSMILLAVAAAHANREDLQAALQTCLEANFRFHPPNVQSFIAANFDQDSAFATKFDRFVTHLELARLIARPDSLSRHIVNLSSSRTTGRLQDLYESIINGLKGPDAYLAADPSLQTSTTIATLTSGSWMSFLSAFIRIGRRDLVSKVWEDQRALGMTPGVSLWTTAIDTYSSLNQTDEAIASWNMMKAQGIQPDALTYRAVISVLFKSGYRDAAWKVFQAFYKLPSSDSAVKTHSLTVYNTVIDGLLSSNAETAAQSLVEEMEKCGPKPDTVTYNTLLAHYGRQKDFRGLKGVINRMTERKVAGDVFTFSTILSTLLKAGRSDAPDLMINMMKQQGIQPNVATYSSVIDHLMKTPTVENLEVVMRLLQRMEEDTATQPNVKTYTSILAGLHRIEGEGSTRMDGWRREILVEMKKRRVEFNQATYHILIGACLKNPRSEGLDRALWYYRELRRRKLTNETTWYVLLLGLARRGDLEVAKEIIGDMLASGHQPSGAVHRLVLKISRVV